MTKRKVFVGSNKNRFQNESLKFSNLMDDAPPICVLSFMISVWGIDMFMLIDILDYFIWQFMLWHYQSIQIDIQHLVILTFTINHHQRILDIETILFQLQLASRRSWLTFFKSYWHHTSLALYLRVVLLASSLLASSVQAKLLGIKRLF